MGKLATRLIADETGTADIARSVSLEASPSGARLLQGFVAGFAATLFFHQTGILLLHLAGFTLATPWSFASVPPFDMPQVFSLACWGGFWGGVFVSVEPYLARTPAGSCVAATLFGAIFPTLVAWFIVGPLQGLPVPRGFYFPTSLVGPISNALWGLGMALFLLLLMRLRTEPA